MIYLYWQRTGTELLLPIVTRAEGLCVQQLFQKQKSISCLKTNLFSQNLFTNAPQKAII